MNELRNSIKMALRDKGEINKKAITINLNEQLIIKVDKIAKKFTDIAKNKVFSRNSIIESAIENYINEASSILENDYGIILDEFEIEKEVKKEEEKGEFDTVVFPAHNDGFNETFLGENCWYAVRIREDKVPKLKYIAIYRSAPVSGITHVAEIENIQQYKDTNKKIIYFKDNAIKLDQPVGLGNSDANSMRSPRYTTIEKLKKANEVKDLF